MNGKDGPRLLVVGGGGIGERHVRCFLEARPRLPVELCEPRFARRVELVSRYPLVTAHADFGALDLSRFDAAVLATPADLHVAQARRLLAAGCHVLVEKPLCVTARGVVALAAAARRSRRVCAVAYTYRNYPQLMELASRVRSGEIGRPRLARVTMAYDYPRYRKDYRKNYFARPETGGGAVLDIASHAVAWLTWVLGEAESVQAQTARLMLKGIKTEDTAVLILRFRSGAIAEVWASACQPRRKTEFELIGPGGHLRYTTVFEEQKTELAWTRGDVGSASQGYPKESMPGWKVCRRPFAPDEPFVLQARNFLAAVEGRERARTTLDEALHVQRVCWAAKRSALTGRRIPVAGG